MSGTGLAQQFCSALKPRKGGIDVGVGHRLDVIGPSTALVVEP